jgi:branched-chain amino acid transport system substrate-binding protein
VIARGSLAALVMSAATLTMTLSSGADEASPLKIGIVSTYSQPDATAGREVDTAIAVFMQQYGDTIRGRKVQIVRRDTGGPQPDVARRMAQELIVGEKVDYLIGPDYTPTAAAIGPITTEAKKPTFVITAAHSGTTEPFPFMLNFGYTQTQYGVPFAKWAYANGIHTMVQLYADFGAGVESAQTFKAAYEAAGGKMLDVIPVPTSAQDFSAYAQRVADKKPDGVYVFLLPGAQPLALLRSLANAGLVGHGSKLRILDNGSISNEPELDTNGDAPIGVLSSFIYSDYHQSKVNRDFVARFEQISPNLRPNYYAAITYDAMAAIYRTVAAQKGGSDPQASIDGLLGVRFESPRGPIEIDGPSRSVTENVYIRRVERRGNHLVNVEIATFPMVKQ